VKRLLLDTNVYAAFKRNDAAAAKALGRADALLMCATVLGELLCGFKCGRKEQQNREELEQFLDAQRVSVVDTDGVTAEFYAEIYRNLRTNGSPVPTNDMWIAAAAMQHGAAVCTLDAHFRELPGLAVEVPTPD